MQGFSPWFYIKGTEHLVCIILSRAFRSRSQTCLLCCLPWHPPRPNHFPSICAYSTRWGLLVMSCLSHLQTSRCTLTCHSTAGIDAEDCSISSANLTDCNHPN
jgi:hypothetical protein